MKRTTRSIVQLGDLVAAVFDSAEQCGADPVVVSRLARRALGHLLGQAPGPDSLQPVRVAAVAV